MTMIAMMELPQMGPEFTVFFFLSVGAVSLFTFLTVVTWAGTRQKEREAYYKAEMLKKIAEMGGERNPALDYMREQERIASVKRTAGFKLGGLVNVAIGAGLMILLHGLVSGSAVYLTGVIPLLLGVALLVYGFWLAPVGA